MNREFDACIVDCESVETTHDHRPTTDPNVETTHDHRPTTDPNVETTHDHRPTTAETPAPTEEPAL